MKQKMLSLILCICLLSGCGFNAPMRRFLSDRENYHQYECTHLETREEEAGAMYFHVSLTEEPRDNLKYDNYYSEEYGCNSTRLEVLGENIRVLEERGFFEEVTPGTPITIVASPLIYMDGNYFFIIGVRAGDKVYLDTETGLENMIDYMNDHKSLI